MKKKQSFMAKHVMPAAKALEKHKLKTFLIMYSIWLVDLFTTAMALGFFSDRLIEANPLAASFFKGGLIGWFMWMVFCAAMVAFLLYLPDIFMKIELLIRGKMSKEKFNIIQDHFHLLRLFNVILLVLAESFVILNNTRLLVWNLF